MAGPVSGPSAKTKVKEITYATTFTNPFARFVIKAMEWTTGKWTMIRMVRRFEAKPDITDHQFYPEALEAMGIRLTTPQDQIDRIPKTGPVVLVANHPHGLVDGLVLGDLMGQVRSDFRILTRSLLVDLHKAAAHYMIPVPFPHDADALQKGLDMRARAKAHLKEDGIIGVFPSGVVASSDTLFGPAIERDWNVFTVQLIFRNNATVVPVRFVGQNSRWYHMANRISATLRQGLLIFEIANQKNKPQAPIVGKPITPDDYAAWRSNPRGFAQHLREITLAL
ncbi:MAG: lysophospholipid acyltransferase family protein [Planktomarina sp.]